MNETKLLSENFNFRSLLNANLKEFKVYQQLQFWATTFKIISVELKEKHIQSRSGRLAYCRVEESWRYLETSIRNSLA